MTTWNEVIEKLQDTKDMGYSHEELIEEIEDDFWGYSFRGENEVIIKFVSQEPNLKWRNEVVECYTYHAYINHEHAPIAIIKIEKRTDVWGEDEYAIDCVESSVPYVDFKKEHAKTRSIEDINIMYILKEDDHYGDTLTEAMEDLIGSPYFDVDEFEDWSLGTIADNGDLTLTTTPEELIKWLGGSNYKMILTDIETEIEFDVFNCKDIDWKNGTFKVETFTDETSELLEEYYQNN